jgi:hypothetical protein
MVQWVSPNVRVIEELERIEINKGFITAVPFLGEHADVNIRAKMAYHISIGNRTLLIAADSNNIESKLYEYLHGLLGDVDAIFIRPGLRLLKSEEPMAFRIFAPLARRFYSDSHPSAIRDIIETNRFILYMYNPTHRK